MVVVLSVMGESRPLRNGVAFTPELFSDLEDPLRNKLRKGDCGRCLRGDASFTVVDDAVVAALVLRELAVAAAPEGFSLPSGVRRPEGTCLVWGVLRVWLLLDDESHGRETF